MKFLSELFSNEYCLKVYANRVQTVSARMWAWLTSCTNVYSFLTRQRCDLLSAGLFRYLLCSAVFLHRYIRLPSCGWPIDECRSIRVRRFNIAIRLEVRIHLFIFGISGQFGGLSLAYTRQSCRLRKTHKWSSLILNHRGIYSVWWSEYLVLSCPTPGWD